MMLPAVLVTNDDGIEAPGIRALVRVLGEAGICRVYVCAPHQERSAVSHCITLREVLEANLVEDFPGATLAYSLSGTPADCASLGISGEVFPKPVLVLSGINLGGNSGQPIIYSGTVAGAREAHICGVPAVALSLDWAGTSKESFFEAATNKCMPIIKSAMDASVEGNFPKDYFLNVNVPVFPNQSKGYRLTRQSTCGLGFGWKTVGRRSGQEVVQDLSTDVLLPQVSSDATEQEQEQAQGPRPLPGLARGRGGAVALPGMTGPGAVALPGLSRGGGRGTGEQQGMSLAQLGALAARKGASRRPAGGDQPASSEEQTESVDGPKHRILLKRFTGPWAAFEDAPDTDLNALAEGYITITPLALAPSTPPLIDAHRQVSWLDYLLS